MPVAAGFSEALSLYLKRQFSDTLADLLVFVPTSRVAARVRARLSLDFTGVLPAILPLRGNGEVADLLGFEVGGACAPWAAQLEIVRFLKEKQREAREDAAESGAIVPAEVKGARLWRRAQGIYRTLDRLAAHGLTTWDLRNSVPESMTLQWEVQATTLLEVSRHMDGWLAGQGLMWSGRQEKEILERAAAVLADEACPWIPVVAGVLDGLPAAHAVMEAAAARGAIVQPELGEVTRGFVAELEATLPVQPLDGVVAGEAAVLVAETDPEEAWAVALKVKQAVVEGVGRIGVVSPDLGLLERVAAILAELQVPVSVAGQGCVAATAEGRQALALHAGLKYGTPADWIEAMVGAGAADEVMTALMPLAEVDIWLDRDDWHAAMELMLENAWVSAESSITEVALLAPLEARLMDFDLLIVSGLNEGTWPAGSGDPWLSEPQLRALGLPDAARKAKLAGTEFESALNGGSRSVLVTRAKTVEGRDMVPSRCVTAAGPLPAADAGILQMVRQVRAEAFGPTATTLGAFMPTGDLWPSRWSASFVEAMLACPYKALGERVLGLTAPDPLLPQPDPRVAGLLVHRWLEKAGKEISEVTTANAEAVEKRLLELAAWELRTENNVVKAIWSSKFAKLAPALVARWLADGRRVDVVEKRLQKAVGPVTLTATLDRVERATEGAVIIDYKTGTPPSWSSVASGERPQLALEAWLLGQDTEVASVEYWQLRGYGSSPLNVTSPGGRSVSLETILEPVPDGVAALVGAFPEGAPFMALPDKAGGGLMATGVCARCDLAGVCRRKAGV
ncbi:MAG: hypothetical protein DI585_00715 [Pseudomonas fluorescens]|nr:MAG: hypothetical protein DI585_00715 [Pseudomonas fluorescens]